MGLALLITPTSSSKAFCAVSLAYNNRINADNSYTKIVIMLVAACFKNSSSETLRNRTWLEKNSTMQKSFSSLLLEKYIFIY